MINPFQFLYNDHLTGSRFNRAQREVKQTHQTSALLNQAGETAQNASETAAGLAESYQNTVQKLEEHVQKKLNLSGQVEQEQQKLFREFNGKLDQIAEQVDTRITNYIGLSEEIGNSTLATLKTKTDQAIEHYNNGVAQTLDELKRKEKTEEKRLAQDREQLQTEINQSVEALKLAHNSYLSQLDRDIEKLSDEVQKVLHKRTEALRSELEKVNRINTEKFDGLITINKKALADVSTQMSTGFGTQNGHLGELKNTVITNLRSELEKVANINSAGILELTTSNSRALTKLSAQIIRNGDTQQKWLQEFINAATETLRKNSELINPFSERIDNLLERVKKTQDANSRLNDYLRELHMGVNERFSALSTEVWNQVHEFQVSAINRVDTLITHQETNEKIRAEQFQFIKNCFYGTLTGIVIIAGLVVYRIL